MRVKECMCSSVVQATPDTTLSDIAKLMSSNKVGSIPICNTQNHVVGFITDRDIITRCIANNLNCANTKASDIMNTEVIKTTPDTDIKEACECMSKNQIRRLPVIEDGQIVGILSMGDLAQSSHVSNKEVGQTLEYICDKKHNC